MIEKIGHYSLTNPASVYDEEALTALELAGRTAGKVNECVKAFNQLEADTEKHLAEQDASLPEKITQQVDKYVKDGSFDEAISDYMGDLESRVNNLINNTPEGSTTMDVEVIDIRLDANGKTHGSAGEAVREQVLSLSQGTSKPNLINKRTLTGGYIQTTGALHPSHQTTTFQKWEYTSDLIPVTSGVPYTFSFKHKNKVGIWYAISTYDANGVFIARPYVYEANANVYARTFTFPENVIYVRVSYRSYMTAEVKLEQSAYASQIPTKKSSNNLLDEHPLQFEGYIVDNGSIFPQTADGYIEGEPAMREMYTSFIPVNAGETYALYHVAKNHAWGAVGIYSEDGNAITRITVSEKKNVFTVPENAVALMVCARTHYLEDLALFKVESPMTAEQRAYENYIALELGATDAVGIDYDAAVKGINHRGYNGEAPENTLSAFKLSAKHGFKYVECDVNETSDGVPVLLHDATVDRTSNGTGDISTLTFSEVRALDFGNGEKIPSFAEFMGLCKSLGLHAYVEIKKHNEAFVKKLVGIVRMYGMRENVTYISFSHTSLGYVRNYDAKARLGYVTEVISQEKITNALALGGDVFMDIGHSNLSNDIITLCAENDLPIEVWTVNSESSIIAMNPYISGVTSDNLHAGKVLHNTTITGTMTPAPANLPRGEETASVAEYEGEVV